MTWGVLIIIIIIFYGTRMLHINQSKQVFSQLYAHDDVVAAGGILRSGDDRSKTIISVSD